MALYAGLILLECLLYASGAALATAPLPSVALSKGVKLGQLIGNGTFGIVSWGHLSSAHDIVVTKTARTEVKNAESYLTTEAHLNHRLCLEGSNSRHVAPYLGDCIINGSKHLIWLKSGNQTLEDIINMPDGLLYLSKALDLPNPFSSSENSTENTLHVLARDVLRQILTALSYCHALGIVHRDIKPANILVDEETRSLRIIDFGSACDMANWVMQRGYVPGRGPLSILYCAPEEFVQEGHPYAFDVYSAAITWLRIFLPGLRFENALYDFRLKVRDQRHELVEWHEQAALSNTLPEGWDALFGCAEGRHAFRLLTKMMQYDPARRPSASEALLGPYLNPRCTENPQPSPPPVAWSLSSHLERWASKLETPEECVISDEMYGRVVSVELRHPVGLLFQEANKVTTSSHTHHGGAVVAALKKGKESEDLLKLVHPGDALLAIGPIDVEETPLDHILEILERWPRPTVSLHFLRYWGASGAS